MATLLSDINRASPSLSNPGTAALSSYFAQFAGAGPFAGYVPRGFIADFLGCLTDASFRQMWGVDAAQVGGSFVATEYPTVTDGEPFFEAVDWFEAAREARESYTMVTLGACYGAQAVGAYRALQQINPMRAKLVAVEAEPENFVWLQKHFRDNGIDPADHWLLQCALSDSYKPVLFPVGGPGSGANNCYSLHDPLTRQAYAEYMKQDPHLGERIARLIVDGDTGIETDLVPGRNIHGRLKFVSAVPLIHVLAPLTLVDLLEADIQQSEITVFPPAMDAIKAKVKRVHVGTHGDEAHELLLQEFATRRFQIVFNYAPDRDHETPWGSFHVGDGIISARNMDL